MQLSIILPCYNAAATLPVQLEALARQVVDRPTNVEVIFVNNGSTDDSSVVAERYKTRIPNFHVIDASAHRGRPQARNAGAQAAVGDALVFCDADDQVGHGWLSAMEKALTDHDFVACQFDTEKLNPPWIQQIRGGPQQTGLSRLWYPPFLPYAGGSSLGVRRALHEAVGGFDESLPFLEDAEYCIRIQQHLGKELHFVSDAVVHIRHRTTLLGLYHQASCWAQYNEFLFRRYRECDGNDHWRWRRYAEEWMCLLKYLLHFMRCREGRALLFWRMGWQIGLLKGSLLYRVPPVCV
jgi:glycosyltransferase involved in cell wall biosynthesis